MQTLDAIRKERQSWFGWKNIAPLQKALIELPVFDPDRIKVDFSDTVTIKIAHLSSQEAQQIEHTARLMKPWRKGPFRIGNLFIDSEWQSFIKYNLLEPHFDLEGKVVGDIGCNNGYYLFRMLTHHPAKLIGFDPSALYATQFQFLNHFIQSNIKFELLGVEHLPLYEHRFDVLFCLGVLYHRSDPIATLKALYRGLNHNGQLFLDTFMIEGDEAVALCPKERYSKIPNVYFIPTIQTLRHWCMRAGFSEVEVLSIKPTSTIEQRKTEWIDTQSLEDFLDPNDTTKTVEGYPAPTRAYIKAYKH